MSVERLIIGASTQISFVSPEAIYDRFNMNLFNTEYNVYSHSYLCYGAEQIRRVYVGKLVNQGNGSVVMDDPCLQTGYNQSLTYNDIFDNPCVKNRSAPSLYLNTSATYSIMYEYILKISIQSSFHFSEALEIMKNVQLLSKNILINRIVYQIVVVLIMFINPNLFLLHSNSLPCQLGFLPSVI